MVELGDDFLGGLVQEKGWQCWFQAVQKQLITVDEDGDASESARCNGWRSMIE